MEREVDFIDGRHFGAFLKGNSDVHLVEQYNTYKENLTDEQLDKFYRDILFERGTGEIKGNTRKININTCNYNVGNTLCEDFKWLFKRHKIRCRCKYYQNGKSSKVSIDFTTDTIQEYKDFIMETFGKKVTDRFYKDNKPVRRREVVNETPDTVENDKAIVRKAAEIFIRSPSWQNYHWKCVRELQNEE